MKFEHKIAVAGCRTQQSRPERQSNAIKKFPQKKEESIGHLFYPEQPLQPQWTHSTILPSSNLFLGTRQMQFVAKLVSRVCKHGHDLLIQFMTGDSLLFCYFDGTPSCLQHLFARAFMTQSCHLIRCICNNPIHVIWSPGCSASSRDFHTLASSILQSGWDPQSSPEDCCKWLIWKVACSH